MLYCYIRGCDAKKLGTIVEIIITCITVMTEFHEDDTYIIVHYCFDVSLERYGIPLPSKLSMMSWGSSPVTDTA